MKRNILTILLPLFAAMLFAIAGCSSPEQAVGSYYSDLTERQGIEGEIARKSIAYNGIDANPLIVVHGFLGGRLKDAETGNIIWGEVRAGEALRRYSNSHLQHLALPMRRNVPLDKLRDNIVPDGIIKQFKVFVGTLEFKVDGYDNMLAVLSSLGYHAEPGEQGRRMYVFSYDWRRDLPENAARLERFIANARKERQKEILEKFGVADYDVHFDMLGHSMGGLLTRYYLRYGGDNLPADGTRPKPSWRGARFIDRAILAGTPNRGYLDTCVEMVNGLTYAKGALPYPPAVIGTFPTYYQMMPPASARMVVDGVTGEPLNIYDIAVWEKYQWGLLDPGQDEVLKILLPNVEKRSERLAIARDHLKKCLDRARQFTETMETPEQPPDSLFMMLILGDAINTAIKAETDPATGKLKITEFDAGDGKVPAISARADTRLGRKDFVPFELSTIDWDVVIHLPGAHMGIIQGGLFCDNLSYYLLASPAPRQRKAAGLLLTPKQTDKK